MEGEPIGRFFIVDRLDSFTQLAIYAQLAHAKPQDTAAHNDSGPTPELPGPEHGLISHTALARAFAETLRTHEENKVSNRLNRWKDGNTVGNFAGNVANAKKVADAQATKVSDGNILFYSCDVDLGP